MQNKRNKSNQENGFFGDVADAYTSKSRSLPDDYLRLIIDRLGISCNSTVLELGCGTGVLAARIAEIGAKVYALDASAEMIRIARKEFKSSRVKWIISRAEDFSLRDSAYDAIVSFEAFHLFANQSTLLRNLHASLKEGGKLGIGWYSPEWEEKAHQGIVELFDTFGAPMGDWGYWKCPRLSADLGSSGTGWLTPENYTVEVASITPLREVVRFLMSIERVSKINASNRPMLAAALESMLSSLAAEGDSFSGNSTYSLIVTSRVGST